MIEVTTLREARDDDRRAIDREWLLDEALEETFPASDPVAAVQPGSTVASLERPALES